MLLIQSAIRYILQYAMDLEEKRGEDPMDGFYIIL